MKKFLYFFGTYCQPCKQLGPIMNEVAQTCNVEKIDIDSNPTMTQQFSVRGVPTVVLVDNSGQEITRFVGVRTKDTYINAYNS